MWEIIHGDCRDVLLRLPERWIHCVVTSPPYFGLRDYGLDPVAWPAMSYAPMAGLASVEIPAWSGCLGFEPTPEAFVGHMVAVFDEIWRVLRDDGTAWVNLGDSYANDGKWGGSSGGKHAKGLHGDTGIGRNKTSTGLKAKDLIGIPWRVAMALQARGWTLRSDIIWQKQNPMPESVCDRPTKAHEYLFLLSKGPRYFYDAETIKDPAKEWQGQAATFDRGTNAVASHIIPGQSYAQHRPRPSKKRGDFNGKTEAMAETGRNSFRAVIPTRNKRSVWTIPTQPFPEAHFATYPPALVRPCIMAGTSERGCCTECGAPWERIIKTPDFSGQPKRATSKGDGTPDPRGYKTSAGQAWQTWRDENPNETTGWRPTCKCEAAEPVPCRVLDPFSGAGTTIMEALRLGREGIGIEAKSEYADMARRRIEGDCPLFNQPEVVNA